MRSKQPSNLFDLKAVCCPFKDWNYNSRQAAMLESGIDDSPMYVESTFNKERGLMELHDVGTNAMYIGDCIALAEMASVLGKDDEAQMLRERAESMVRKHLLNEDEFWGEWIIPSITRDDPMFKEQRYWRGAIWAPMNFLTYF